MSENIININNNEIKLIIREMDYKDCEEVLEIWSSLDSVGAKYANQMMLKVDSKGIFVAQDLNTGKLLGVISGIILTDHLGHIGQFAVRKEYQKLGIGKRLFDRAMEHIGKERTIHLNAKEGVIDYYRDKYNFILCEEKVKIAYIGKVKDFSQLVEAIDGISVVPISDDNIERVIQYDKEVCDGLDRSLLIQEMVKISEYVNAVALNQEGDVLGYCLITVTNTEMGFIEPLYANDEKIAELLLGKCVKSMPITQTNGLVFCCWNTNAKMIAIAEKLGIPVDSELPILYTKQVVNGDMDRIFCMSGGTFYPF